MTHADSIWAKALEAHNDSLQRNVDALQAKLEALQSKTDLLTNVVETANDGVSNQLSSATYWLEVIAILITIGGFVLGFYISYKKRQIEKMAQTVDDKKKVVEELAKVVDEKKDDVDVIAKSTEELDKKIHGDLTGLYKDLRKEETNALLERLVLEPQDVENLGTVLCARDIDETGYVKLKTAYFTMKKMLEDGSQKNVVRDYSEYYIVLFYQHFFYKALIDDEISPEFEKYYGSIFSRAFNRDMIKSTIDLCKALSEETSTFDKELVLVTYLKALNSSQFSEFAELKNIFEQNISPQTLLQNAISRCTAEQVYLKLFNITPPASEDAVTQ